MGYQAKKSQSSLFVFLIFGLIMVTQVSKLEHSGMCEIIEVQLP